MDNDKHVFKINDAILRSLLSHYKISFTDIGKNIGARCLGVACPFCGDTGYHCGVFKDGGNFSCWRCEEKGSMFGLLKESNGITYSEFKTTLSELSYLSRKSGHVIAAKKKKRRYNVEIELPRGFRKLTYASPEVFIDYLQDRNFTVKEVASRGVGYCVAGKYALRLIIPIFYRNKMIAYQARDITGRAESKYMTSYGTPINSCLYNIDNIKSKRLILVEGVFDAWRIGEEAACSFGTHITKLQKRIICNFNPEELIFVWDSGAYKKAKKHAQYFAALIDKVKIVSLPSGKDPDELGKSAVLSLIDKTNFI